MKKLLLSFTLLILSNTVFSQIDVNPAGAAASNFTPQELIENVLLTNCASVNWINEKVTTSGSLSNYGYFEDNGTAFPLASGIVLGTGWISLLEGTNNSSQSPNTPLNEAGDPDLQTLCDANFPGVDVATFDAVCFEFEIVPDLNSISFSYIFASEEYDDFDPMVVDSSSECFTAANQGLQDTFAILVSGPGIVPDPEFAANPPGTQWNNIAKIPATMQPVSVGTIHGNPTCTVNPSANNALYNSIPIGTGDITLNGMTDIMTAATPVTAGQTYRIKLVLGDRGDFQSDSAVFLLGSTIGLNVDLGPDLSIANGTAVCGLTQVLDAGPGGTMYSWTGPGGFTANTQVVNVSVSGTYTVDVTVGGCTETDSILIDFVPTPGASRVDQVLTTCDDTFGVPGDGIGLFDLTTFQNIILGHPANAGVPVADLNILFYETEMDAINNTNPIADPVNYVNLLNNPQDIYFRVENVNSPGCLSPYVPLDHSFQVRVLETPQISPVNNINVCDIDVDGSVTIDLTPQETEAIGALVPGDVVVNFYDSQNDADANINPYPGLTTTVMAPSQEIFVRISNNSAGGGFNCFTTTSFIVTVLDSPQIPALTPYEICDNASVGTNVDGLVLFDLTTYNTVIINGQASVPNPTFHTSQADADIGANPIANPNAYANVTPGGETIFARIVDSVNGCHQTATLDLVVTAVPVLTDFTLVQCEVDAVIDGITLFSLTEANPNVITTGVEADYIFSYHLTQADADGFVNPLGNTYTNNAANQVIFVRVQNIATTCYNVAQVTLSAVNNPVPQNVPLDDCDIDGNGIGNFILSNANPQILPSVPVGSVIVYYLTELDAQQETSPLPNNYTSISANQVIYYRVESAGDCFGIGTVVLNSNPLPVANAIAPYTLCSDDGVNAIFDLSSRDALILNGQTGMTVTYHISQVDADAGANDLPMVYGNVADPEDVFARVENNATGCFSTVMFQLMVNQNPAIMTPTPLNVCDVVTDGDGQEAIDLTVKNNEISGADPNLGVTYYPTLVDAQNETNEITGLYTNIANPDVIHVRVEDQMTGCFSTTTLTINVNALPVANTPADSLYACDSDNDGVTNNFILTDMDNEITGGDLTLTVTYYETQTDAEQELNEVTSPYSNINNMAGVLFARVENTDGCFRVVTFNITPLNSPQLGPVTNYPLCDADQDGTTVFDLTSKVTEILNGQVGLNVSFYTDLADANAGNNPIITPAAFVNTNPLMQTIFFRIENPDDGNPSTEECSVVGQFDLIVNLPPVFNTPINTIQVCDDDFYVPVTQTARFTFDLTIREVDILNSLTGISFEYFDADTGLQINTPTSWENITNPDTIEVVGTDSNGCSETVFFDVRVVPNPTPSIDADNPDMYACDGTGNSTGVEFDLRQNEAFILQGEADVIAEYYETYEAANTDPQIPGIANPTMYNNTSNPQIIYVRVTNQTTMCYTITSFNLFVPVPEFELGADQVLCVDQAGVATNPVQITTGLPDDGTYTFNWTLDGNPIAGTNMIGAVQTGTYQVEVALASDPTCIALDSVNVTESSAPFGPLNVEVTTSYFVTDSHTLVATIGGGSGSYLYSLNGGPYQMSNTFNNVPVGLHTVTVIDENGCEPPLEDTVPVIGYRKFFTPNGDGFNETWQIIGVEGLPDSKIYIFDRYGKLLKQLNPLGEGWDGTYNGSAMPSTDYWFKIVYQENGQEKEFGAHFSLKR